MMDLLNNKFPYFSDALLSKKEIEMRHFLMYDFNVTLKSLLFTHGGDEFEKYFFNCCRQTAILGTLVLESRMDFNDYTFTPYEGVFIDKVFGNHAMYEHCFIIASHKDINRRILIDMARTTNPLVFEPIDEEVLYPSIDAYKDMKLQSYCEIDYMESLRSNTIEYLTKIPTQELLLMLAEGTRNFAKLSKEKQDLLTQTMYMIPHEKLKQFKQENKILLEE